MTPFRPLRDVGALGLSQGVIVLFAFLTQVLLARSLSKESYGALAAVMALVLILGLFASFGLGAYWLECFGRGVQDPVRLFLGSFVAAGGLAGVTFIGALLWAVYGEPNEAARTLLLWLAYLIVAKVALLLATAALQLRGRYTLLALVQTVPHFGYFLTALLTFSLGLGVVTVARAYLATALLLTALSLAALASFVRSFSKGATRSKEDVLEDTKGPLKRLDWAEIPTILRGAWPFALAILFGQLYFQSDIVLVSWLRGAEEAGGYNVAFQILAAVYLLPYVVYRQYLMPRLYTWFGTGFRDRSGEGADEGGRPALLAVYRFGNGSMLAVGLVLGGLLALLAPWGVTRLFGARYEEAAAILQVLALAVPVQYLASSSDAVLTAGGLTAKKVNVQGVAVLFNVGANLLVIPRYGAPGAALTTVLTEILMLGCLLWLVRRYVFGSDALTGWTLDWRVLKPHV